jgi:hypothetical protein
MVKAYLIAAAVAASTAPAGAAVLFSNPTTAADGDCQYNSTCGGGTRFGAQRFTLGSSATVDGAATWAILLNAQPASAINFRILSADGSEPGAALVTGQSAITPSAGPVGRYPTTKYSFAITPTQLSAGTYFLAVQAVTSEYNDYLAPGEASGGAFLSTDSGSTWLPGYSINPSIAIEIYGPDGIVATPAPAMLSLLGSAFAAFGLLRRLSV